MDTKLNNKRFITIIRFYLSVFKKNFLEYIRYPANFVFFLIMPVVFILPYYFLMESFAPGGVSEGLAEWTGSNNFSSFFMLGLLVAFVLMKIFWGMGFTLKRLMDIGMLETIWVYPISRIGYILAESLFNAFQLIFEIICVSVIVYFVFKFKIPFELVYQLPWIFLFFIMIYGFGIGFAALVLLLKNANMLVDTSNFIVTTITGTNNPVQVLPKAFLAVAMAVPITYFIDYLRVSTMGIVPLVPIYIERLIIIGSAVVTPLLGSFAFIAVDKHCRKNGSLGAH